MSAKTVIIGLGGVGSGIVCELERYMEAERRSTEDIRLVVMDTDVNTISRLKREKFSGGIVQMSDRMTVGEYLDKNETSGNWFLRNEILDWKPVTEGAGQVRAVSRLAFELAIRDNKLQPLFDAIRELHAMSQPQKQDSAFRILVISSLAGGTGSGLLLPLALYLRKYMFDTYKRRDVIIRGMFLMSDCLEHVVADANERKSLRGNTYAAIKELDAFMKKADGYLPGRYANVYMENTYIKKEDKYLVYNFCYLFGARDEKGKGLYSFQELKNYVIQCIDAQVLGAMEELNNSIEDNVLKSTMVGTQSADALEFNRYCAAGIKVLKYPYYKIVDYLCMQKTQEVLSNQWMELDNEFFKEQEKQRERREKGYTVREISCADFYLNYVRMAGGRSQMVKQIRRDMRIDKEENMDLCSLYLSALGEEVRNSANLLRGKWKEKLRICNNLIELMNKNRPDRIRRKVEQLEEAYDKLMDSVSQEIGATVIGAEQKYFGQMQFDDPSLPWHFFHWLKREDGEGVMHLNSVRFFLYETVKSMEERRAIIDEELERNEYVFRDIDKVKSIIPHIPNVWVFNFFSRRISRVLKEYGRRLKEIGAYCENMMLKRVYSVGIERLSEIIATLEMFYQNFNYNQIRFQNRQDSLFEELTSREGRVVQYVKTDKRQLDLLAKRVCDYYKDQDTNNRLSAVIFDKLWNVSGQGGEEKKERIEEIFQKDCVDFWRVNLEEAYSNELDITVVDAIVQEGIQKKGNGAGHGYLRQLLEDIWKETLPYLQIDSARSAGQIKNFCTFHPCILDNDRRIEDILKMELEERGGTASQMLDKFTIIFYRVMYNLRASDVKELMHGTVNFVKDNDNKLCLTTDINRGGSTFRDYNEIVRIENRTKLTPHIDKNWGNILIMPDLNPVFTEYLEKQVYRALFYMWVNENITCEENENKIRDRYSYSDGKNRKNHFSLHHILFELAGSICNVDLVLGELQKSIENDLSAGILFEDSRFGRYLDNKKDSIFDILVEYLTEEAEVQWNSTVIRNMVEGIIELLEAVVQAYFPEDARVPIMIKNLDKNRRQAFLSPFGQNHANKDNAIKYIENIVRDVLREHNLL